VEARTKSAVAAGDRIRVVGNDRHWNRALLFFYRVFVFWHGVLHGLMGFLCFFFFFFRIVGITTR
jgi:hypothetical protein